jgi:glycosyltransferase involved in cell wall biosynthesis
MRILLLTAYFPPDTGSASHLFYELGKAFLRKGHEVFAITSVPGYFPRGDLRKYRKKILVKEIYDGIHLIRLSLPKLPRQIPFARAIWQFSLPIILAVPLFFIKKPDVTLVYSPPLPLSLTGWLVSFLRGIPFVLNVQDLFPQSVIDLGLLRNPVFIGLAEAMEKFIYRRASLITVHSSSNKNHVITKGVDPDKISVIHNWVDIDFIKPGPKENYFRDQYDLNGKFVVSFAGILGYSQDIDVILQSAKQLESFKNIQFLIVGDGVYKPRILRRAKEMNVINMTFLPMEPRENYPQVLYASDISLSTLYSFVRTPVVPSKILSIMASGIPVIATMDLSGDASKIINDAKCGFALPPEDPRLLSEAILKLYDNRDLCEEYGKNGREYVEQHFSLKGAVENYEKVFMRLQDKD